MIPILRKPRSPLSPSAIVGFVLAIFAIALALFGTYNPWGALKVPLQPRLFGISGILFYGGTFVLPIFLGIVASLFGGLAMKSIEDAHGKLHGAGHAVFAVMIGLFAAVLAGVNVFSALIWPMLVDEPARVGF